MELREIYHLLPLSEGLYLLNSRQMMKRALFDLRIYHAHVNHKTGQNNQPDLVEKPNMHTAHYALPIHGPGKSHLFVHLLPANLDNINLTHQKTFVQTQCVTYIPQLLDIFINPV